MLYGDLDRDEDGVRVLTPEDWSKGRAPTGYAPGYRWVDPHGQNRTKAHWPYSYSEHYLWGSPRKGDEAVYSDRLAQWHDVAWKRAWAAVAPARGFVQLGADGASKFLSAYYEKPIQATALAEGCNQSSGYPYWVLWFRAVA